MAEVPEIWQERGRWRFRRDNAVVRANSCDRCASPDVPRDGLNGDPRGFATVVTGDPRAVLCRRCWWRVHRRNLEAAR